MIPDAEKTFEEIVEIYGGIPLKADFLAAGNERLAKRGLAAYADGKVIRIPFMDRPLFAEEDYAFYGLDDEINADMKKWRMRIEACVELAEDPGEGVCDAYLNYYVDTMNDDGGDYEEYYEPRREEFGQAVDLAGEFLDGAVDCGE